MTCTGNHSEIMNRYGLINFTHNGYDIFLHSVCDFVVCFNGVHMYYGIAFMLYITGIWVPTLTGIALLFGIGNAFDSLVSWIAYRYLLKKEKLRIY